jgi:hypothetical protein
MNSFGCSDDDGGRCPAARLSGKYRLHLAINWGECGFYDELDGTTVEFDDGKIVIERERLSGTIFIRACDDEGDELQVDGTALGERNSCTSDRVYTCEYTPGADDDRWRWVITEDLAMETDGSAFTGTIDVAFYMLDDRDGEFFLRCEEQYLVDARRLD